MQLPIGHLSTHGRETVHRNQITIPYLPTAYLPTAYPPASYLPRGGEVFYTRHFLEKQGGLHLRFLEPPSFAVIFFVVSEEKRIFTREENLPFQTFGRKPVLTFSFRIFEQARFSRKSRKSSPESIPSIIFSSFSRNLSFSSSNPQNLGADSVQAVQHRSTRPFPRGF